MAYLRSCPRCSRKVHPHIARVSSLTNIVLPKARCAAYRACSGEMPPTARSSLSSSRCARSSRSSSSSRRSRHDNNRRSAQNQRMSTFDGSRQLAISLVISSTSILPTQALSRSSWFWTEDELPLPSLFAHSSRNALVGSMRDALHAGIQPAPTAVIVNRTTLAAKTTGSPGLMP